MTLTVQFLTLVTMVGMGIAFGAMLDTYNHFLNRKNRKRWLVFIHDIFFWIFQGLLLFYVLFKVNNGEIRFYIFLALLCGFSAYQALFKNLYMKLLKLIIRIFLWIYHCFYKFILYFIVAPIKWIIRLTKSLLLLMKKGLLALLMVIIIVLKWILKLIMTPIIWILRLFWKIMPERIKNVVDKYYNKLAGFLLKTKNLLKKLKEKLRNIKNNKVE